MANENEDKDLLMVGDGATEGDDTQDQGEPVAKKEKKPDEGGDDEDEEEEGVKAKGGDSRTGHADDEDEGEDAEQTTRRQERQKRKQRQREARERNERELNFLRSRNETLERRFTALERRTIAHEGSTLEQRINSIRAQIETAKDVEAKAIEAGNGADSVEARDIRTSLEQDLQTLEGHKERLAKPARADNGGGRTPPPEARLALQWIDANKHWYDPAGGDEDSLIARAIEDNLVKTGHDPRTPEYWKEFDKRIAKRLPHVKGKAEGGDDDEDEDDETEEQPARREQRQETPKKKTVGPKVSVGGRERPLKPNEVYISPDRRRAMEDAGVWDDPKLRQKYLKSYRKYDEENRS